ncbi:hypothetical protein HPB47_013456 [Ixodes persulcatus]|uniref:Uncharacterized protein n=1 Tax=Ixodes persulcatus TaxID=34615 RepID=A0AC60R3T9_IXOPE|nr:hypothetical protein HPB47_013456 [Ixodes persulcatus]
MHFSAYKESAEVENALSRSYLLEKRCPTKPPRPPKGANLNIIEYVWRRIKVATSRRPLHRATAYKFLLRHRADTPQPARPPTGRGAFRPVASLDMAPKFVQGQDGWHHAVPRYKPRCFTPSDHLNLTKHDPCQIHTALRTQAALAPADASKFMVCVDKSKNLAFLLCLDSHVTQPLQEITSVDLDDRRCGVTIYPATPSNTCKGVIHNFPAGTSPEYLMRHMSTLRPEFKILAARMMGRTTTALITFHGTHIPHEICYAGGIFRCRPHRPKAQYCHRCQQNGHRIDVCTYNARCPTSATPARRTRSVSAAVGPHRADDAACKDKQAADAAVRQLAYNKRIAQRKATLKAEVGAVLLVPGVTALPPIRLLLAYHPTSDLTPTEREYVCGVLRYHPRPTVTAQPATSGPLAPSSKADHLLWDHNPAQPHTYTREWLALAVSLEQQRELAAHINRALSCCLD